MAQPVLSNLDLNGNQLLNAKTQLLASDPGSPADGDHWINTTTWTLKYRINGETLEARLGDITSAMIANGTIVDADISASAAIAKSKLASLAIADGDVAAGAAIAESKLSLASDAAAGTASRRTLGTGATQAMPGNTRLDTIASPTGSVSMNNQKITGMADGTAATDAATVGQLNSVVAGIDSKASVIVAYTTNISLTGAASANGGVTPANGDRVLATGQTTPAQNGIYIVNTGGAWTRATDMDAWGEVPGAMVAVERGSEADSVWLSTADAGGTLGTTAITWTKIAPISAGTGTVNKFAGDITGNASATQFTVTHNLNTTDVNIAVYDVANDLEIIVDKKRPTANTVRIDFAVAPANAKVYRVVVIG